MSEVGGSSIARQAEALDDSDVWTKQLLKNYDTNNNTNQKKNRIQELAVHLQDLEFSLRCFQCKNFLRAPVSVIPCNHVYCSECIRIKFARDLHSTARKASCSLCNVVVDTAGREFSKCLVPHASMDALVHQFRRVREPLLQRLVEQSSKLLLTGKESPTTTAAATDDDNNANYLKHLVETAATAAEASVKGGSEFVTMNATNRARVALNSIVAAVFINETEGGTTTALPTPLPPERSAYRPKLSHVIYKGKTRRQLVELCEAAGIGYTTGTDADLQRRHSDYITLYNAECDSLRPRSKEELLAVVVNRDLERRRQNASSSSSGSTYNNRDQRMTIGGSGGFPAFLAKLKQERKILGESSAPFWSSVPTGFDDWDTELEEGFERLIAAYRERCPTKKPRCKPWIDTEGKETLDDNAPTTIGPPEKKSAISSSCSSTVGRLSTTTHDRTVQTASACRTRVASHRIDAISSSDCLRSVDPSQGSLRATSSTLYATIKSCFTELRANGISSSISNSIDTALSECSSSEARSHSFNTQSNQFSMVGPNQDTPSTGSKGPNGASHVVDSNNDSGKETSTTTQFLSERYNQSKPNSGVVSNETKKLVDVMPRKRKSSLPVSITQVKKHTKSRPASPDSFSTALDAIMDDPVMVGIRLIGPWTCSICTFRNEKNRSTLSRCEVCDAKRSQPSAVVPVIEIE